MKRHGGDPDGGLPALERGVENLAAHLRIVQELGFDAVVAVNKFPGDSQLELEALSALALERGAFGTAINDAYAHGGAGASALAELVVEAANRDAQANFAYDLGDSIETKLNALARKVYGGTGAELSDRGAGNARAASSRPPPSARVCREDPPLSVARRRARRRPDRLRAPGPRVARLHRRGLARRRVRRDPDDARPAAAFRRREDGSRRGGPDRRSSLTAGAARRRPAPNRLRPPYTPSRWLPDDLECARDRLHDGVDVHRNVERH